MSTVRFIISYIALFIMCMLPMMLFGQPVLSLLLLLMLHARLTVTFGWPAYPLAGALSFLSVAYLTHSPMCGMWFALTLVLSVWVGFLTVMAPIRFRFSEAMCATAAAFLLPFSMWEMSFIRLSGKSIHQLLVQSEETALRYLAEGYGTENLAFMKGILETDVMPLLEGAVPAAFTIIALVAAYIILVGFSQAIRFSTHMTERTVPGFSLLRMPKELAILWIGAIACLFVPDMRVRIMGLNVLVIISFVAAICGISMADYFFRTVVKSNFIRWIIYAFALEMTSFLLLLPSLAAGMADTFFNFRKLKD